MRWSKGSSGAGWAAFGIFWPCPTLCTAQITHFSKKCPNEQKAMTPSLLLTHGHTHVSTEHSKGTNSEANKVYQWGPSQTPSLYMPSRFQLAFSWGIAPAWQSWIVANGVSVSVGEAVCVCRLRIVLGGAEAAALAAKSAAELPWEIASGCPVWAEHLQIATEEGSRSASRRLFTRWPCWMAFPVEVRNPLCCQRVPKSWTTPKAYLLSVKIFTVWPLAKWQARMRANSSAACAERWHVSLADSCVTSPQHSRPGCLLWEDSGWQSHQQNISGYLRRVAGNPSQWWPARGKRERAQEREKKK